MGLLSGDLHSPAILFAFGGNELSYWLFSSKGNCVDRSVSQYHLSESRRDSTTTERCGLAGKLELLPQILDLSVGTAQIQAILEENSRDCLQSIARLFGIANLHWGYRSLFRSLDELNDRVLRGWSAYVHVGDLDPRGSS
ncbi:hypothetical protein AYO44_05145 [Planctomycetaceae bacterium SCGC AG-212-F19]|nr:hypothetical protein AYO44_05145 [Planctomycetaceae bacterium SCGC AG-212-F19]